MTIISLPIGCVILLQFFYFNLKEITGWPEKQQEGINAVLQSYCCGGKVKDIWSLSQRNKLIPKKLILTQSIAEIKCS